jgi:hypothetical protein
MNVGIGQPELTLRNQLLDDAIHALCRHLKKWPGAVYSNVKRQKANNRVDQKIRFAQQGAKQKIRAISRSRDNCETIAPPGMRRDPRTGQGKQEDN